MTLIKIENTNEYLCFDTEVTSRDIQAIQAEWESIKIDHPTWDRMDCIGELIEVSLPKFYGLKAEYFSGVDNTITLR